MLPLLTNNILQLALTLGGLAGLLALLHFTERSAGRFLSHRLGWNALLITGWLGVPVHELSHLALCKLFGHRVIACELFAPDPVSGTLGFVRHGYSRRSTWQILGGLFIGLAPLLLGGPLLLALLAWMVTPQGLMTLWGDVLAAGDSASSRDAAGAGFGVVGVLVQLIWQHRTPWLPLQFYLAVCLASHLSPGLADLKGALPGGLVVLALLTLSAGIAAHLGLSLTAAPALLAPMVLVLLASALFLGLYVAGVWGVLQIMERGKRGKKSTRARRPRRCRA